MSSPLSPLFLVPLQQPDAPVSSQAIALCRSLHKLPRRKQRVLLLSRLDALPYADIARQLEIDVQTVEKTMVRVLEHCRRSLQGTALTTDDNTQQTTEQASRWYVHLQSPHATASQRIEFRHWLDADHSHLLAFEATERLWRQLQPAAALLGGNGWHRRKRRTYIVWCLLTAFVCGLLVTAEAFS